MNNWKTYKLGDIAKLNYGKALIATKREAGNVPVYSSSGISGWNDLALVQSQGIIVGRKGTVGSVYFSDIPFYCIDTAFYITPKNHYDLKFLYYKLKSLNLSKLTSDSAVPGLNRNTAYDQEIVIPEQVSEQKEIAFILSSLDVKIELNQQMNQTLEEIAQTIFKEWFVNFNFPGFDGELVDGLPKGWRVAKVSDTCRVNANTLNAKDEINCIQYIEISEVEKGVIKNIANYKRGEEPSRAKRKLVHGDIAISTVRPNRGSYFLALYPDANLIASTGFAVFTATSVPFSFLYCFLTNEEQIGYYGRMADGAAYPAINPVVIMNIDLVIPSTEVLELFSDISTNLYVKVYENLKENKILTQIRDRLLPKLMSGKIEIAK